MKHRSKKLLGRGNQQYFNQQRRVNLRAAFYGNSVVALPAQSNKRHLNLYSPYRRFEVMVHFSGNRVISGVEFRLPKTI